PDPVRGHLERGHRAQANGQVADLHRPAFGARWHHPDAPRAADLARDPEVAPAVPAGRGEVRPHEPAVQALRRDRCMRLGGRGQVLGINSGRGPGDAGQVVLVHRDGDLVQLHLARARLAMYGGTVRPFAEHLDGAGGTHVVEVRVLARVRYVTPV